MNVYSVVFLFLETKTDLRQQVGFFIDAVLFHDFLLISFENDIFSRSNL